MCFRVRAQLAEALGAVNRFYCSQAYGQPIDDHELLLRYFIKSGGAEDFAYRYAQAMSPLNRWYCSEFHGREVSEAKLLWDYYMAVGLADPGANLACDESREAEQQMSIAS